MATHSSILAWEIPWTEEPEVLQSVGLPRVMSEQLHTHTHTHTHTHKTNLGCRTHLGTQASWMATIYPAQEPPRE